MSSALLVIDVQNDFCPGGALAVADGDSIVPIINAMMPEFDSIIYTQDWHPADHSSFAANHDGATPFSVTEMPYGPQVLWPTHCAQGTVGAAFHDELDLKGDLIIRKGFRTDIDSYSAFFENDHETATGLTGYLRTRGIGSVTLAGLALDFCVAYSAVDAAREGFRVTVMSEACRAIDLDGSLTKAMDDMAAAGVTIL
ncbi:bifunctional nicotinamidase/pyrazinamidase [Algicella marina]|uniref:Nicotinamidase n=1 Tax=Algicella marina TaxID=2683284 RepID=A0A6P1T2Q1_9RHOB|nr:bifunctional nicotinamidase/pyrazinamidase [Algicella marina]QHQ36011.1 bifunctional nicotinamidase/pyrazinamidase [Algicella marina]